MLETPSMRMPSAWNISSQNRALETRKLRTSPRPKSNLCVPQLGWISRS